MKFTVSTKPLADALSLGVVPSNVTKYDLRSGLAQVSTEGNMLKINLEAKYILTELRLKGSAEGEPYSSPMFVDCLLLRQLVSTLDSSTVTLEFTDGGIILHSGKSRFTLSRQLGDVDITLKSPRIVTDVKKVIDIDKEDWKFIKDRQMYAIAMSFIHPVYTMVWVGDSGDVLVGDFDNSLFTHSVKSKLGKTCLLPYTIINLFNSLPDGAQLSSIENSYRIEVTTDGYEYISEFTPQYESEGDFGSYNSDIILQMMEKSEIPSIGVSASKLDKFLGQAVLLSDGSEDTITFGVQDSRATLKDKNVECTVDIQGAVDSNYSLEFKTISLKSAISNYGDSEIRVGPMRQDGQVVGIILWDDSLVTVIAGVD